MNRVCLLLFFSVVMVAALSSPVVPSTADESEDVKVELVKRLFDASEMRNVTTAGFEVGYMSAVERRIEEMRRAGLPEDTLRLELRTAEILLGQATAEFWSLMQEPLLKLYVERLEQEEIESLLAFHESEIGRRVSLKQVELIRASAAMGAEIAPQLEVIIMRLLPSAIEQAQREVKEDA